MSRVSLPNLAGRIDQPAVKLSGDTHRNSMLRVAAGNRTVNPSSSSVMMIWHPSRDVLVRPKARSSMSSSSSLASCSSSYHSGSTITWQVEQASEPSQAPSISTSLRCAISRTDNPSGASTSRRVPSRWTKIIFGMRKNPLRRDPGRQILGQNRRGRNRLVSAGGLIGRYDLQNQELGGNHSGLNAFGGSPVGHHNSMRDRPSQRAFGAQPHPFQQSVPFRYGSR